VCLPWARRARSAAFSAVHVPAIVVLGFWIVLQFINGIGSVATTSETGGGGVAYLAHIGGFVAGLVLIKVFATRTGSR
jgi:membrane associated rhomboid family serine protease